MQSSIGLTTLLGVSGLGKSMEQRLQEADKDNGERRFKWQTAPVLHACFRPND
jgi:hypothetical protein